MSRFSTPSHCVRCRCVLPRCRAVVGAGVGAIAGGITDDARPRFRSYVTERKVPSYRYTNELRVGADLPSSGVTKYRYTVVNDRTVLVDPGTHKVIQIIE